MKRPAESTPLDRLTRYTCEASQIVPTDALGPRLASRSGLFVAKSRGDANGRTSRSASRAGTLNILQTRVATAETDAEIAGTAAREAARRRSPWPEPAYRIGDEGNGSRCSACCAVVRAISIAFGSRYSGSPSSASERRLSGSNISWRVMYRCPCGRRRGYRGSWAPIPTVPRDSRDGLKLLTDLGVGEQRE